MSGVSFVFNALIGSPYHASEDDGFLVVFRSRTKSADHGEFVRLFKGGFEPVEFRFGSCRSEVVTVYLTNDVPGRVMKHTRRCHTLDESGV